MPERVRLATLDAYDGEVFRSGGSGAVDADRFVRVPAVARRGRGRPVEAEIIVDGSRRHLDADGRPARLGRLRRRPGGVARRPVLLQRGGRGRGADGRRRTRGGRRLRRPRRRAPGRGPRRHRRARRRRAKASPRPRACARGSQEHVTGSGGAALAGLVALLRERGYLSHGLSEGAESAAWMESLPDYSFQPSASGHSLARIDALFARLLERETDPRAEASGNYVAAVGDDEQFAVAVALIARELGFPARVVVGARLSVGRAGARDVRRRRLPRAGPRGVDRGAVLGRRLGRRRRHAPVRAVAEPRGDRAARSRERHRGAPRHGRGGAAARPAAGGLRHRTTRADEAAGLDLAWLWPILRITGIALLVLALRVGPFLVVIGAKAARRRSRRTQRHAGRPHRRRLGRVRGCRGRRRPGGTARAHPQRARRGVRHPVGGRARRRRRPRRVLGRRDRRRRRRRRSGGSSTRSAGGSLRERGFWRAIAATVSLRSFFRHLAPATGARTRIAERGKRRALEPARLTP